MKTFLEWLKLNEMPLKHYGYMFNDPDDQYRGRDDDGDEKLSKSGLQLKSNARYDDDVVQGRYTKRDKIIISHPRTFRLLEEKLKNSKYNFNILFIEERKKEQYITISKAKAIFEKRPELNYYFESNGIDIQNSITFIQVGSAGHLMTPWIILHRIGHAIGSSYGNSGGEYPALTEVLDIIYNYFNKASWGDILSLFKFKSAVDRNISGSQELVHELIAEYLWNGKIRSNSSDERVLNMMNDIGTFIDLLLESCVGKIMTVRG